MVTYEARELQSAIQELRGEMHTALAALLNNSHAQSAALDNASAQIDKIDSQTTPVIGWHWAAVAGVMVNVIWLPLMQHAGIPYVTPAINKLTTIENIIVQEIGIGYAMTTDAISGEGHGVHPSLMAVYRRANELANQQGFNIHIRDGLRTVAEQAVNVRNGASTTMNSRHLKAANGWGHALDLEVLYDGPQSNEKDWEGVNKIKPLMSQAASDLRIPIEWGGDWKTIKDGFHWQLPWGEYPANRPFAKPRTEQMPVITERNISALLAEIKRTESSGGNYSIENKDNCMQGAYQFSASTLAELGYIDMQAYRASAKQLGGAITGKNQCDFLNNAANWTLKGGKQTFLASSAMQDKAAGDNIRLNLQHGINSGAIDITSSQATLTGYSKAAWFGHAKATAWYRDGKATTDGNGSPTAAYAAQGESIATEHTGTGNLLTIFTRIKDALWNPQPTQSPST